MSNQAARNIDFQAACLYNKIEVGNNMSLNVMQMTITSVDYRDNECLIQ